MVIYLEAPNLEVVPLKEAAEGDGLILRLREITGRAGEAVLCYLALRVRAAHLCNGVEESKQSLWSSDNAVVVSYKPCPSITVRLKAQRLPQTVGGK